MPERGELLYRGSVKDVYGREGGGAYSFVFSDRYSIFDWGEMPDSLPRKGEALAVMGDLFFRFLGDAKNWRSWKPRFSSVAKPETLAQLAHFGLLHHSFGLVDETGKKLPVGSLSNQLSVLALSRLQPKVELSEGSIKWNYSAYQSRPAPMLVPLEVVFRFGAPTGSSFLERARTRPGYVESCGLKNPVKPDSWFSRPIVEFFTKLEPTDRFLPREEAKALAGMTNEEFTALEEITLLTAMRLQDLFAELGLELWDGKFEFSFQPGGGGPRGFALVDSVGPDELRLVRDGTHFSKEILRRHYRPTPWYAAVEKAKTLARSRGELDWKKICRQELGAEPAALPPQVRDTVASLYPALAKALAERCFGMSIYGDVPKISELAKALHREIP